jgi:hypothetical protein
MQAYSYHAISTFYRIDRKNRCKVDQGSTVDHRGLRSTVDRRPWPLSGACQSSASGCSGARELQPRGGREGGRASELNGGVVVAQEAVEGRKDDGEGTVRARRGALEVWEASPWEGSAFIGWEASPWEGSGTRKHFLSCDT